MFLISRCFRNKVSDKTIRSKHSKSRNVVPKNRRRGEINTIAYFACAGVSFSEDNVLARKEASFLEDNLTARKEVVELSANFIDEKDEMMIAHF